MPAIVFPKMRVFPCFSTSTSTSSSSSPTLTLLLHVGTCTPLLRAPLSLLRRGSVFPNLLIPSRRDDCMSVPIALCCETENKCDKDEAHGSLLFRCKDKNVAPNAFARHGGKRVELLRTLTSLPSQRRTHIRPRRRSKLEGRCGNRRPRFVGVGRNETIAVRLLHIGPNNLQLIIHPNTESLEKPFH